MHDDVIKRWFGRLHNVAGVAAYGLRDAAGNVYSRTWNAQLTEGTLNELWLRLGETAHSLLPPGEPATQARWTFAHHTVAAATREDGATFFVLQAKQTDQSDARGIERVTSEFRALRSGA